MKRGKGFLHGVVIGILVFICMAWALGNPSASQAEILTMYSFSGGSDGAQFTALTLSGSTLYGVTYGVVETADNGTIFQINTDGAGYKALYSFGSVANDGANPLGPLTLSGSTLYGVTANGGYYGAGTIFQINTAGTGYKVLYSFSTYGTDGLNPSGSLILLGATLYGVTSGGGDYGYGTIFQINTDGTGYGVLCSCGSSVYYGVAPNPNGPLTLSGSTFYGVSTMGGYYASGAIFQANTDGTGYEVLYNFNGVTGTSSEASPYGSLILSGSTLYGVTSGGGTHGYGTIFQINTDGTGYKVLHSFDGESDGKWPYGSLILSGSTLYGTTSYGGIDDYGTIFQINTDGKGYEVLDSFDGGSDAAYPQGSLTLSGSTFYGTTFNGGKANDGTIFSLTLGGTPTVDGTCGSSNGGTFTSAPTAKLCSAGNPTTVSGSGPWSWTCQGVNGATNAGCSANVQPAAVNGVCGSSNGGTFTSAPTSFFCSAGTATTVSGSGPWSWTCTGANGGKNASCSAKVQSQGVNGACGSANGEDLLKAPTSNLCSTGKASKVAGTGPWDWTCAGSNGGATASCSANLEVNGACGSAKGKSYLTTPTIELCKTGTPSSVSNNGQWNWTCAGSNGGGTANCSAKIEVKGACGSANEESFLTEPTSDLCTAGTVSKVTGKGPWEWSCEGSNGGSKASCSAKLEVNGSCGSASGESLLKAPTSDLCGAGKATKVTGTGPWNWTCEGANGGTTASCSANDLNRGILRY